MTSRIVSTTSLGQRPIAVNNLNGESFQQDVLVTYNGRCMYRLKLTSGWQYCAVYIDHVEGERRVKLSRRELPSGLWESFIFDDHTQTSDDGHNVICIGICHQDGSFHMSWDLHSSVFNYRRSTRDVVSDPKVANWSAASFGPIEHALPGLQQDLSEVSPLFLGCSS
jgi:hypothetical protein